MNIKKESRSIIYPTSFQFKREAAIGKVPNYPIPEIILQRIVYFVISLPNLLLQDTFEYPELEGHEFVCNHLAPRLKGRPRGRRRRLPRSRSRSRSSRSSDSDAPPPLPREPKVGITLCNHLTARLKGRPRGLRRKLPRSREPKVTK